MESISASERSTVPTVPQTILAELVALSNRRLGACRAKWGVIESHKLRRKAGSEHHVGRGTRLVGPHEQLCGVIFSSTPLSWSGFHPQGDWGKTGRSGRPGLGPVDFPSRRASSNQPARYAKNGAGNTSELDVRGPQKLEQPVAFCRRALRQLAPVDDGALSSRQRESLVATGEG